MNKQRRPAAHLILLTSFESFAGHAPDVIPLHSSEESSSIVLGRGSQSKPVDFILSAKSNIDGVEIISRHQARITNVITQAVDSGLGVSFVLDDLHSLNGVFVNRARVDTGVVLCGKCAVLCSVCNYSPYALYCIVP